MSSICRSSEQTRGRPSERTVRSRIATCCCIAESFCDSWCAPLCKKYPSNTPKYRKFCLKHGQISLNFSQNFVPEPSLLPLVISISMFSSGSVGPAIVDEAALQSAATQTDEMRGNFLRKTDLRKHAEVFAQKDVVKRLSSQPMGTMKSMH